MDKIRIIITDFYDSTTREVITEYGEKTTIQELLETIGITIFEIDFMQYFEYGYECCNSSIHCGIMQFPYIISEGVVDWLPNHKEINVLDFINTVDNNEIKVIVGIPSAGSLLFQNIIEMWDYYATIFSDLSSYISVACFSYEFIKWLRGKFGKTAPPLPLVEFITKRKEWNSYELAKLLKITVEDTKHLLKGFGFEYDNSLKLYIKTERTEIIVKEIKNIPWEGDG